MPKRLTQASLMGSMWLSSKVVLGSVSSADLWPDPKASPPAVHRAAQHGRGEHQESLGDGRGAGSVLRQVPRLQGRLPSRGTAGLPLEG